MAVDLSASPAAKAGSPVPLLAYGFRPFFLLAGAYGALAILAWVCILSGELRLPASWPLPLWHGHEMVFGFAVAGITGFLLTAVPSWTGAAPVRGATLLFLVLLWVAGRLAFWGSAALPAPFVAAVDLAFLPCLAGVLGRSLIAQISVSGFRNAVFLVLLAALWTGNLLTHLDGLGIVPGAALPGLHLGIDVLLLAITIVGGRIVPNFTANVLRKTGVSPLPRSVPALDAAAILSMAAILVLDLLFGSGPISAAAAIFAACTNGLRLWLWRPLATIRAPLLWVLHLGYAWLVLGLALKGIAGFADTAVPPSAALHALTAGAIGTMLLAVMSRVALGHTGRPLIAPRLVVAAYGVLTLAAALRVAAPLAMDATSALFFASGILWATAMALFTAVYAPMLLRPRPDGNPG